VKINSGLVRKLPAAGCFNHTVRNAWSRCREENSRGDFESDKLFALRAERGQRWRPAIQVAGVCGWEEISSCFEYKTKMLIGCGKGSRSFFWASRPQLNFPSKKAGPEAGSAFFYLPCDSVPFRGKFSLYCLSAVICLLASAF